MRRLTGRRRPRPGRRASASLRYSGYGGPAALGLICGQALADRLPVWPSDRGRARLVFRRDLMEWRGLKCFRAGRTESGVLPGIDDVFSFGPFRLNPRERILTRGGERLAIGGRAMDILIALVDSPNLTVNKRDLVARVCPDVSVADGSLRFHMASLRK